MTSTPSFDLILPLDAASATLPLVGGKGANLSRLARAGFPVPNGFMLTTPMYQAFVEANAIEERISAILSETATPGDVAASERASAAIRALFDAGQIPGEMASAIQLAYARLGRPPVAVRSSATAEDLPDTSFAGQQDTYLNVMGDDALLAAVKACWGSLWTTRAITYRAHHAISQAGLALAVVVQVMVESHTSGVMFTANPLTGLRSETVIDATYGLGEALVSGQVEPDHYVVDTLHHAILEKKIGAKTISIRGQAGGGTVLIQEAQSPGQALPDDQILALAGLGQQVAAHYQAPQDIEWAYHAGNLLLLQSRPVTSLFPTPDGMPVEPLSVMFSFAAVQGIHDPLTPFGRDVLCQLAALVNTMFGYQRNSSSQTVFYSAGERIWVNLSTPLRNSVGRTVFQKILLFAEPTILQALDAVIDDPRLKPGRPGISLRAMSHIARFFLPVIANAMANLVSPAARRKMIIANGEAILNKVAARIAETQGERHDRLRQLASLLPELANQGLGLTFIRFLSGVISAMASFNLLFQLAASFPQRRAGSSEAGWHDVILGITRGLSYNPTTEMDLRLWRISQVIHADLPTRQIFQATPPAHLSSLYQQGLLPRPAQIAIGEFLAQYGGRGLGEIDAGRPRWAESPLQIFEMLASYLRIDQPDQAPDVIFEHSARGAQQAIDELVAAARQTRGGWLRARLVKLVAQRVRELMGIREAPKFFAVRLFARLRWALLDVGREFAEAGELEQADDLSFLTLDEMKAFAGQQKRDWKGLIAQRRAAYERESRRRLIPLLLLSDGRAFYQGLASSRGDGHGLTGSPVSPGSAQGKVRVVFDPRQAGLLPGEILVCRGTDPSWTPLFLSASGLVMETGGMMTHGAVVAREYGIPAIVGVDQATTRLVNGQLIQIDGSTGQIVILEG